MIFMAFPPLVLASRSPRRREMLAWLEIPFDVLDGSIDETPLAAEDPREHVLRIAAEKARFAGEEISDRWVILSADTVVVDGDTILGKPADEEDAVRMLTRLSGREHFVDTAFVIYNLGDRSEARGLCESRARMRMLTAEEILDYVRSGDPMDKAGAYAIQNPDFNPVPQFSGCMANVMGLPLCHLKRELIQKGAVIDADISLVCRERLGYDCPIWARVEAGEEIG